MLSKTVRGLSDVLRFRLRDRLAREIAVQDGAGRYVFRCISHTEVARANTFFVKEEGTVGWIRRDVKPGQVFYDIGANVGLYTVLAGSLVGREGAVYAFEPHIGNVLSLLGNVKANGMQDRVRILSSPLTDVEGFFDFHYRSGISGSSGSQLNSTRDQNEDVFTPEFTELKFGVPVDRLVQEGVIRPPDHVKLDVDGNELLVLRGMRHTLGSPGRPKSLQVEMNLRYKEELHAFMATCGFAESEGHYTSGGKKLLARGKDRDSIPYNAVFRPSA